MNIQNQPKHDEEKRGMTCVACGLCNGKSKSKYGFCCTQCGCTQNLIPYADDVRNAFLPEVGHILLDADYKALEVRVWAWYSQDQGLIAACGPGKDIHTETAAMANNKSPKDVTEYERFLAKKITFGVMYGRGAMALAATELKWAFDSDKKVPATESQVQTVINRYKEAFPLGFKQLEAWDSCVCDRRGRPSPGYVATWFGHKRRARLIPDFKTQKELERQFRNHPIQGTAGMICIAGLMNLREELKGNPDRARMLFPVHDSIVTSAPESRGDYYEDMMRRCMMDVPLPDRGIKFEVDVKRMERWAIIDDREEG